MRIKIFQRLIILIGIATLFFMLWEPHLEGRNANATLVEIYFNDPFLAFAYIASMAYFTGLYHAYKVTGYLGHFKENAMAVIKSLRIIKYCAITIIGFVAIGEVIIILNTSDDRAGGVVIGLFIALMSIVVAGVATNFERKLARPKG